MQLSSSNETRPKVLVLKKWNYVVFLTNEIKHDIIRLLFTFGVFVQDGIITTYAYDCELTYLSYCFTSDSLRPETTFLFLFFPLFPLFPSFFPLFFFIFFVSRPIDSSKLYRIKMPHEQNERFYVFILSRLFKRSIRLFRFLILVILDFVYQQHDQHVFIYIYIIYIGNGNIFPRQRLVREAKWMRDK